MELGVPHIAGQAFYHQLSYSPSLLFNSYFEAEWLQIYTADILKS